MSIYASYRRLSEPEFMELEADPDAAEKYFGLDLTDNDAIVHYFSELEQSENYLDINKDWHGLHFLLTNDADLDGAGATLTLRNVVLGGTETAWDSSYGKVRSLTPKEVREVCAALEAITEEMIHSRIDVEAFREADIYPDGGDWDTDGANELVDVFAQVKYFFSEANRANQVILLSLN